MWSSQVERASWIAERLFPGLPLPAGYPCYARILHPIEDANPDQLGQPDRTRWAELAAWSGVPLEPTTDFWQIALPEQLPMEPVPGGGYPASYVLGVHDGSALVRLLRSHTTTPERCSFGIWEGYGWDSSIVPAEVVAGPRVRLPFRDYLFDTGPVETGLVLPEVRELADIWWPEDQSWFVYGDVDLRWTYVGGSESLVHELVESSELEALWVDPEGPARLSRVIPEWLSARIETAVEDLMSSGNATLATSRFALQLDFGPPHHVATASKGSWGLRFSQSGPLPSKGGWSLLSQTGDPRAQVRRQIISWVIGMVQG